MTIADEAFEGCGQEVGLDIWRIEQMKVVPVEKKFYGKFFDGDAYILLNTRQVQNRLAWDIHFWLGGECSQDEQGVAAYKTVELDDHLGGAPVQYREVQDHESTKFQAYFKSKGGIKYMKGGVASGFRHVEDEEIVKRLFKVKGKRNVRSRQVELSVASLNAGDCFVLDNGPDIYVWVPAGSNRMERLKANYVAKEIRDNDRQGASEIHLIDATASDDKFFEELGGSRDDVAPAEEGGDDSEYERKKEMKLALYEVHEDESGKMSTERVGEKPLKQEQLKHENSYILDGGKSGVYIWIGKESSQKERAGAMKYATNYLEWKEYPKWTPIQRDIDGGETAAFKQFFSTWRDEDDAEGMGTTYQRGTIAPSEPLGGLDLSSVSRRRKVYGLSALHQKHSGKAVGFMPDDGTGDIEIWRVEDFELATVDADTYGMFCGGDSYVIKYSYEKNNLRGYIVYFWQGQASSQDEKAASAIHAIKLDDDLAGKAVQVRVMQGSEPDHFLRMFKGKLVVLMGGKASGFKNIHDNDTYDVDGTRLFHVRGTDEFNTRAVQREECAQSLRTDDVFVLETPANTFVWHGKGCTDAEKDMGSSLSEIVSPGRDAVAVNEGEEPEDFWDALGGQAPAQEHQEFEQEPMQPPRLFQCSSASGIFRVEEIMEFTQEDLEGDDVMLLDTGDEIFVWIGAGASDAEKKVGMDVAKEFIETDPSGRRSFDNTVVISIKQGSEPSAFTANFPAWDPNLEES